MINQAINACMAMLQPSSQPEQSRDVDWLETRWYAADLRFNPNYNGKTIVMGKAIKHAKKLLGCLLVHRVSQRHSRSSRRKTREAELIYIFEKSSASMVHHWAHSQSKTPAYNRLWYQQIEVQASQKIWQRASELWGYWLNVIVV